MAVSRVSAAVQSPSLLSVTYYNLSSGEPVCERQMAVPYKPLSAFHSPVRIDVVYRCGKRIAKSKTTFHSATTASCSSWTAPRGRGRRSTRPTCPNRRSRSSPASTSRATAKGKIEPLKLTRRCRISYSDCLFDPYSEGAAPLVMPDSFILFGGSQFDSKIYRVYLSNAVYRESYNVPFRWSGQVSVTNN